MKRIDFLLAACLMLLISCTDDAAYTSCKHTLEQSTTDISQAESLPDAERIDRQLNDTLYKYGRSKMSSEMIDEIKRLKSDYERVRSERVKFLKATDTVPGRRIVEMPGIGLVEIKSPPEV